MGIHPIAYYQRNELSVMSQLLYDYYMRLIAGDPRAISVALWPAIVK